ncbi:TetR family transcriptional regulator [Bradyrhizobium sp. CSA207]|nr:TetR family transcriptional regulator [Bradyrhizobium sp. CSA207]
MGHSRANKAKNRQRILEAAAFQLREAGLAGVSIGGLMKSTKLTHGGFYGHFASRDELVAEALEQALSEGNAIAIRTRSAKGPHTLKSFLNTYLSKGHRDNPGSGCALSALAGDVARADQRTRKIMTKHLTKYFEDVSNLTEDAYTTEFAISVMCTVVGAITLSRVTSDEETSNKILMAARKSILEYAETSTC